MHKAHDYAPAEVVGSIMLGEQMKRLVISGAHVAGILEQSLAYTPAAWVKIKVAGESGRAYTIVDPDMGNGCFAWDIALHSSSGRGDCISDWAIWAEIGAKLAVAGPRSGGFMLSEGSAWLLLIGDLSAVPALRSIANASNGLPVFLITEDLTRKQLAGLRMTDTNSVAISASTDRTETLHQLVREHLIFKNGSGQVWIAGEAGMMKSWKTLLSGASKVKLNVLTGKGYWRKGVSDHRDESP